MADTNPETTTKTQGLPEVDFTSIVADVLQDQQPMYLVAIVADVSQARVPQAVTPTPKYGDVEDAVTRALLNRIRQHSRPSDTVTAARGASCLLVIRTLADGTAIRGRLSELSRGLSKPYDLPFGHLSVPLHIGAVHRVPTESADSVAGAITQALRQAKSANDGPVLIS